MSITILECRQADAVSSSNPGDWETVLASPIVLENGDQVLLKNAIIDTTTVSQNNIVVEQDTDLTITAYPSLVRCRYAGETGSVLVNV